MRRLLLPVLVLLVAALTAPAEARAGRQTRPDLRVAKGSLVVSGTSVTGRVVVVDKGQRAARRSALAVLAVGAGGRTVLASYGMRRLGPGRRAKITFNASLAGLAPGHYAITACADAAGRVRERSEADNCRVLTQVVVAAPAPVPPAGSAPDGLCATPRCAPLDLPREDVVGYSDASGSYWAYLPDDGSQAPYQLLIWLHGCGGDHGDLWGAADYWGYHYIAIAPDGAEGGCWSMSTGPDRVLAAITSATAHFDVDPHRIVLGGYSSGGDLAYRTAFLHAERFAGVLAMNTAPFRDNAMSAADAAGAAWRFHVFHLLHTDDETYPRAGVGAELDSLAGLGYPVERLELPGTHWDEPTDPDDPADGTWHDFRDVLVKEHMDDGWVSP